MASQLRVNKSENRSGLGTITYTDTGAIVSGIVTANSFSGDVIGDITGAVTGTTGSFSGDVSIAEKIIHTGDTNTFMKFDTDTVTFETAGDERLRITSDGKVLVGDGSAITQGRAFEVRGTGNQGILVGSTNNNGAQLLLDGIGGGDGSGGNYGAFEVPTSGHLTIRNHDADKDIIFGVGSAAGGNDSVILRSNGNFGIGNRTGTPNSLLHVHTGSGDAVQRIEGAADAWLILTSHGGDSQIRFGDASSDSAGQIRFDHGTDNLFFEIGGTERLKIGSTGLLTVSNAITTHEQNIAHFQATTNNKSGTLRINGHSGTNAVQGILELIGYAAGGGHGRHAFITASTDGGTYATRMDFKMRETSAWQHTSMTDKLTLHPGYAGTVDVKGIPAHLRLYSQRTTSDWDSDDPIGKLEFYIGDDTTNNLPYVAASIECNNGQEQNNLDEPSGSLRFYTRNANDSSLRKEKLHIVSDGKQVRHSGPISDTSNRYSKAGWYRWQSSFNNPVKECYVIQDSGSENRNGYIKVTVTHIDYPGGDRGVGGQEIGFASFKRKSGGTWFCWKSSMSWVTNSNQHGNMSSLGTLSWQNAEDGSDSNILLYTSNRNTNYDTYWMQVEAWHSNGSNIGSYVPAEFYTAQ